MKKKKRKQQVFTYVVGVNIIGQPIVVRHYV